MSIPQEHARAQPSARANASHHDDTDELFRRVVEQVELHPLKALAIAAGLGFVLGRGMFGRVAGGLIATSIRVGLTASVSRLAARLAEHLYDAGERRRA